MYQLPAGRTRGRTARHTVRRPLWSRHVADRLDRLTVDRRLDSRAGLPAVLGLR